ncbi:MAG: lipopolysaccharide biosynthesis protein [Terriglobia bacterium]
MATTGRKLAVGSTLKSLNLVSIALVSLLITPFVIHSLGDRMYGIWALLATFVGYYGLLELGLSTAVGRYVAMALGAGDQERCNYIFNTSLVLFSALGGVVMVFTLIAAAIAPHLVKSPQDGAIFWKAILLLGASMALGFPVRVFKGVLNAHLRFDLTGEMELMIMAFRTALIIVVLLMGYKVVALAAVAFVAPLTGVFVYPYFLFQDLPFLRFSRRYWHRGTAREMLSYSAYSFIAHLGGILRGGIGPFIVAPFLGFAGVAHYKIAAMLATYYDELTGSLVGVFGPVFSRLEGAGDQEAIKRTLFFSTKITVCVIGFLAFGLIAMGKEFISRWVGSSYVDAYPCLVLLVLGFTCALCQRPSVYVLYAMFRHKFLAFLICVEGATNLTLGLIFVRHHGLTGVALGMCIPLVASKLIVQPVYVCSVSGIPYKEFVGTFLRSGSIVAVSLIVPVVIAVRFALPNYKVLFALGISSFILYAIPVALGVFNRTETRHLVQIFWPNFALGESTPE